MPNMKWEDFKAAILNLHGSRKHKITNSIGSYDIYKKIRKDKWMNIPKALSEHEFYSIIRTVNNKIANSLSRGSSINLPYRMGTLEIRKTLASARFKNNKVVNSYPIDWDNTLKLWYEDKKAKDNKTLIRIINKDVFRIYYNRGKADYNNKSFYDFAANRELKQKLKKEIDGNNLDAFILWNGTN